MDSRLELSAGPLGVWWRRLAGVYALLLAAAFSCALSAPTILSTEVGMPAHLGEIDNACWDVSSLTIMEASKMHMADNVGSFWDFMTYLQKSPQPHHQEVFMKLAQLFWQQYVNCVLSRAHGLGRRAWRRASPRAAL